MRGSCLEIIATTTWQETLKKVGSDARDFEVDRQLRSFFPQPRYKFRRRVNRRVPIRTQDPLRMPTHIDFSWFSVGSLVFFKLLYGSDHPRMDLAFPSVYLLSIPLEFSLFFHSPGPCLLVHFWVFNFFKETTWLLCTILIFSSLPVN